MTSSLRCAAATAARAFAAAATAFLLIGIGLLKALNRGVFVGDEVKIACNIELRARHFGIGGHDLGFGLRDHRLLEGSCRVEVCEGGLLGSNPRRCLCQDRSVVAVVELDEQISGAHRLIIA